MKGLAAALAATVLLASCDTAPVSGVEVTSGVGPGTETASVDEVVTLFDDVCLKAEVDADQATDALRLRPFTQRPETGTWYHNSYDLSFKVGSNACSIVTFAEDPLKLGVVLGAIAQGKGLKATVTPADDGYLNVVVR